MFPIRTQPKEWITTCGIVATLLVAGCINNQSLVKWQHEAAESITSTSQLTSESKERITDPTLILPGRSVGLLHLGDNRERVLELLGRKEEDEEYSYDEPCSITEIHWLDLEMDGYGLFVYLKDNHVFQIESDTRRYHTIEGITTQSSPENVRRYYPQLRAYVLLNSGMKVNGGRDLIYWVDRKKGIAFEMYYNRDAKKRLVSKVSVFEPNRTFQPGGCVSSPQVLRQLQSFALEQLSARTRKKSPKR